MYNITDTQTVNSSAYLITFKLQIEIFMFLTSNNLWNFAALKKTLNPKIERNINIAGIMVKEM